MSIRRSSSVESAKTATERETTDLANRFLISARGRTTAYDCPSGHSRGTDGSCRAVSIVDENDDE